jgi:hypothetical protein
MDRADKRRLQLLKTREPPPATREAAAADSRETTLAKRIQQRRRNEAVADIRSAGRECTAETRRCPEGPNMKLDTPACCKGHVRRIMADVAAELDKAEIRWWIDYGTLLGYLNFGGMIPWDKDGDLGVYGKDRAAFLKLQERFLAMGYHATFAPPRPTQRFRTGDRMKVRVSQSNHCNVDLFIWYDIAGGRLDRKNYIGADMYKGREFPKGLAFPLKRGLWDGIEVSVPAEPELLAEWRYGGNWREPLRIKHPAEARE